MKCKKIISCILVGTVFLSMAGTGVVSAADEDSVEFIDEYPETPQNDSSIDENTEVPEENLNTEDNSIVIPEETPQESIPDQQEQDIPEVPIEPEEPSFSDDDVEGGSDSQGTNEEVVEEVTPTVTPTEVPEEDIKDITFTFGECRYGSTVSLMDSEDNIIATIRTEDGTSTVEYGGTSSIDGSTVILEDVDETDFHILTDNDMMGSDVSEFSVTCEDGSVVVDNDYENPFWVISERFTLESTATISMSFVNNSFVADEMLDKIDSNPELMEVREDYSVQPLSAETRATPAGRARLEKNPNILHYPWVNTQSCGTHQYFIRHGKRGEEGYWSARAVCVQAQKDGPAVDQEYDYIPWYVKNEIVHPTKDSRRTVILLMLMIPKHPLEDLGKQIWKYSEDEYRFSLCHGAISWINDGTLTPHSSTIGPDGVATDVDDVVLKEIKKKYGKTITAINNELCTLATTTYKSTVDQFNLYLFLCGDGTRQNVCFVRRKPAPATGAITLSKTSNNANLTDNNTNYSLKGAVYGVYSDKACKTKVGSITTDVNGKGKLSGLKLNASYWVKEISPSPGYLLDTNVYEAIPK